MALQKTITYKGFPTDAYYKITSFTVNEELTEGIKTYTAKVLVNSYTNDTKEFDIEQKEYTVKELALENITIANLYTELKKEEDFSGAVDV